MNPLPLLLGAFIIAVHRRIVIAEADRMRHALSEEHEAYCCRVRRYL